MDDSSLMLAVHKQLIRDVLDDDEALDDWATARTVGEFNGRKLDGPIGLEIVHDVDTRYAFVSRAEVLDRAPEIPRDALGPDTLLVLVTDPAGSSWFCMPLPG